MSVRPKYSHNTPSPENIPMRVRKVVQNLLVANGPMNGLSLISQVNSAIYNKKPSLQHVLEISTRLKTMVAEGDILQLGDMFSISPKESGKA